jgi:hypothetical protein
MAKVLFLNLIVSLANSRIDFFYISLISYKVVAYFNN